MLFTQIICLYAIIFITTSSSVGCNDINCHSCGYDCTGYIHDNCISDNFQSCLSCNYPWYLAKDGCVQIPCSTNSCSQCDATSQYCISCNWLFDLTRNGCQIKGYLVGILGTIFLIVVATIFSVLSHYLRKKQREQLQQELQNHRMRQFSNPSLQTGLDSGHQLKLSEMKKMNNLIKNKHNERYLVQVSKTHCTICLEDNCEVISRCGHLFHAPCLLIWISNKNSCPLCNMQTINIVQIITCLKCNNYIKQYNILEFNNESICKIEHPQCEDCKTANNKLSKEDPSLIQLSSSKVPNQQEQK